MNYKPEYSRRVNKMMSVLDKAELLLNTDLLEDMEWKIVKKKKFTQEDAKNMQSLLSSMYRLIHSANEHNTCYDVHTNWRKEFND